MGGLVELDRALGIPAEHTVDDADVEVEVGVQGRAKAMGVRMSKYRIRLVLRTDRYTTWWIQHRFRRTRKEIAAARREKADA